jgi:uncharacterized membrane protein
MINQEEKMNQKTIAIIVTVIAILFCACPGLISLFMGVMFAIISFIPGADINMMGSKDPQSALMFGIGAVVIGLVFLAIAIIAIVISWRRKNKTQKPPIIQ